MLRWVACAGLLAGCWGGDDPYAGLAGDPCAPGNRRAGDGAACAVPPAAIVIDGDGSDWAHVEPIVLSDVVVQFAGSTDALGRPALALRARFLHLDHDRRSYAIRFEDTPEYPTGTRDLLFIDAHGARYLRNGLDVNAPIGLAQPYEAELAASGDGFEAQVATGFLPFPFGARVAVYLVEEDPDGQFLRNVTAPEPVAVCWLGQLDDDASRADPCRGGG